MKFEDWPIGWKVILTNVLVLVVYHKIFHK